MKNIIDRIAEGGAKIARYLPKAVSTRLAVAALTALAAGGAWADATANNPVTGVSESYTYKYVGSESDSTWEAVANWRNADDTAYSAASGLAPNLSDSGVWTSLLFDGSSLASGALKSVSATTIEGYTLNLGIFNGAQVTIGTLSKWQDGCKVRVDDNSSSLTISALGSKAYGGAVDYYVAGANGVTYSCAFNKGGNTHNYYLTGAGSVSYQAISAGTHVIKQADVALDGGTKARKSKTLVSFTSSSISFSADATIYVKDSGGTTKRTITATQITSSTPTISTDYPVGTCELVQESDGIKLYYIDGDYDTDFVAYIGDDPTANKYHTIVEAAAAIAEDNTLVKLTLLSSTEESFVVPSVGFVFDTNGKTVTGTISGASGVGLTEAAGVYTGIANTAATWTGTAGDGLWENAQNWSTKSVPASTTTVTFENDATVEMGATETIYGLVVTSGKTFTLYRTGNSAGNNNNLWGTLKIGAGQVTGGGTVKLICTGISKMIGDFNIDANIEFQNNGSYDSFLQETVSGSFILNGTVTGTGYLQVKTSTTFNGNVTIPEGSIIKVNSYAYNLGAGASLSGAGTLVFDGAAVQSSFKTALQDATKWTGTCELRGGMINNLDFAEYGNENSYVGVNGVGGYLKNSASVNRVADGIKGLKLTGNGLTMGTWSISHTYVIAADISGSGPINLNTQSNAGNPLNDVTKIDKFVFTGDMSGFTGAVKFKQSSYRPCYIFASESDIDSLPTPTDYGQMFVLAGKTVNVGAEWNAPGGFFIDGTANLASASGYLTGSVSGSGVVKANYTHSSGARRIPNFATNSKNTFEFVGMTAGWISNADGNGMPNINAAVKLSGNVKVTDGHGANDTSSNITTFKSLSGSGNLEFAFAAQKTYANYTITTLNAATKTTNPYTGQIKINNKARLVIGAVDVDEVPYDGTRLVSLSTDNRTRYVNAEGTPITENGLIAVTVGGVANNAKLFAGSDGLYVAVAKFGNNYYATLKAAADAAMAAGGDTIAFTRIDSGAATSLLGWAYDADAGTFTRSGYVRNTTTGVEYTTLDEAISQSSSGDTIQLLYDNSEIAVDTSGKDFVFDENGYAFIGTWTGSGRIVLQTAPTTTTWAATSFVSSAENDDPTWTGTVALDWENIVNAGELPTVLNKYGIAASFVEIGPNGTAIGYFSSTPTPKIRVSGSLTIHNGSSGTKREISYVTGSGTIKVNSFISGTAETTNYKITTLDKWTGRFENYSSKMEITNIGAGTGVIYTEVAFSANPTSISSDWQGRVVFNYQNILSAGNFSEFGNKYGVVGSILEIGSNGTGTVHLGGNLNPDLIVNGNFTFNNGSSGSQRTINKVSGSGALAFTSFISGTAETTNYKVSNLADWDGRLTVASTKITISNIKSGTGSVQFDVTPQTTPAFESDWQGTFVMNWSPSYDATPKNTAWVLDNYGVSGSTVVVGQAIEHGYLKDKSSSGTAPTIAPAVYLKANMTLDNGYYNATTVFTELGADTGVVLTTRSSGDGTPYQIKLLRNFNGSINLLYGSKLTIDVIERDALPPVNELVVAIDAQTDSTTPAIMYVSNTKIRVDGDETTMPLAYATMNSVSGLYKAVASYNTSYYATMTEAIDAAVADSHTYEDVTILDATATCPDEYYIDNGTLKKKPAAVCTAGTLTYYTTIELAMQKANEAAYMAAMGLGTGYDYVIFFENAAVTQILDGMKIKQVAGVTVTVATSSAEFTSTPGAADAEGIVTYALANAPTAYTWTDAYFAPDPQTSEPTEDHRWSSAGNWSFGSGTKATRCPQSGDTVSFSSASIVTLDANAACASITIAGCAVSISADSAKTLTAGTISLTAAESSISVTDVTLSPVPTTTVANAYVKTTTAGSTTTYAVAANPNPTVTITADEPVFQDYTNATIVATVTADGTFDAEHATYTATVGNQSYDGKYENGRVTFEIPGLAGASANVTITATPQDSDAAVATTDTSFVFGTATDWFAETATTFETTGDWENADTSANKIVLSGDANATFTPTKKMTGNTADVVWVVSFDAPNDDDLSEELVGAQTAFRLATGGFQLWVTNGSSGAWVNVAATGITPATGVAYTITNHFDYSAHTLTASVNGVPLAAKTDGATTFALPSGTTKVNSFEFAGSGALTGIAGNFINTMLYVDGDGMTYATLAEVPSGKPVTALDSSVILTVEPGLKLTVPAGMPATNIKPTYKGASISGYVNVSIEDGKVTLSATEAAKPSATAMTADRIAVGNVKPGLYYWVEASTKQNFTENKTVGTPVQATSEAAVTVEPKNPTGKVIFYRVAVDAEKPATATP